MGTDHATLTACPGPAGPIAVCRTSSRFNSRISATSFPRGFGRTKANSYRRTFPCRCSDGILIRVVSRNHSRSRGWTRLRLRGKLLTKAGPSSDERHRPCGWLPGIGGLNQSHALDRDGSHRASQLCVPSSVRSRPNESARCRARFVEPASPSRRHRPCGGDPSSGHRQIVDADLTMRTTAPSVPHYADSWTRDNGLQVCRHSDPRGTS